jgi:hypothetical protein
MVTTSTLFTPLTLRSLTITPEEYERQKNLRNSAGV